MAATQNFEQSPSRLLKAGPGFQLSAADAGAAPGYTGKKRQGQQLLAERARTLAGLQEKLFATGTAGGTQSLLLVLQAMDTAGKGGIISHVVGSVNPQGVQLKAFKAPTDEEKAHDFLWRIRKEVPGGGMIGVFDRSHYEDVLIHRVHQWATPEELDRRYLAINEFEAELAASGTRILKVMLNISPEAQKERLTARLKDPHKYWKYNTGDLEERGFWPQYMEAYQRVFELTGTDVAPWYVVPADRKWYARLAVQELLVDALKGMDLQWPKGDFNVEEERRKLAAS